MATQKTNKFVEDLLTARMEGFCLEGHFPKVKLVKADGCKSFSMFDYMFLHARVALVVHVKLVAAGFEKGIFATRLRSQAFQDKATEIVNGLTVEEIKAGDSRFQTWAD